MYDYKHQKHALLVRLAYYKQVFPSRSPEYVAFKQRHSIPRIHEALRRLEDGSYGKCAKCQEQIDEMRLELVPGALFCLECQKETETNNKKRARP
jgi:RNA polymerase-binding transcription factor DksA